MRGSMWALFVCRFSTEPQSSPAATAPESALTAVSSTQPVQSPSGASERIFVPHFRQALITLIMIGALAKCSLLYFAKFYRTLSSYYRDEMAQLVFNVGGRSNRMGNLFS